VNEFLSSYNTLLISIIYGSGNSKNKKIIGLAMGEKRAKRSIAIWGGNNAGRIV
jgi:hypothetical protein